MILAGYLVLLTFHHHVRGPQPSTPTLSFLSASTQPTPEPPSMPSDYSGVGGSGFMPSGFLGTIFDKVQDAAFALASCLPCKASSPSLKLNGRSLKIIKLLGEGGFSEYQGLQRFSMRAVF